MCCYPKPRAVTFDQGGKFTGNEFQELLVFYGINPKTSTSRNPQSNGIIEPIHSPAHNMLQKFDLQIQNFNPVTLW